MSPTTNKPRGGKTYAELKRSRSQGTQRKLVKAQTVTSTDDPYYGGGVVFYFKYCSFCTSIYGLGPEALFRGWALMKCTPLVFHIVV